MSNMNDLFHSVKSILIKYLIVAIQIADTI